MKIKVGDRVTRLGDNPLRWGTVIRLKKQTSTPKCHRDVAVVIWDHLPNKESVMLACYLWKSGIKDPMGNLIKEED